MNKIKRIFAFLMAMVMVLGMSVTGFAEVQGEKEKNAEVTISDLDEKATQVSFYKLIKTTVNADNSVTYELTELAKNALGTGATVETITGEGADLQSIYAKVLNHVYNCNADEDATKHVTADAIADVDNKSVTQELELGCYAALVTTTGAVVYNPMIVSVNAQMSTVKGHEGELGTATATNINAKYTPIIENKDTTNGATTPTQEGGSASVGDKVEFTLSATIPTYPADAQNKTLYMMDTLSKGLTLGANDKADETASFKLHIGKNEYTLPHAAAKVVVDEARNAEGEKTFAVVFNYDELKKISGDATSMTVTYNVTVNTNAVVAGEGNKNTYKLVYANNPTQGGTYIPGEGTTPNPIKPQTWPDGVKDSEEHTQTIYTYAFAIKKIDASNSDALKDAEFAVYADADKTIEVGTIKTDDKGYGALVGVEEGTYYIKETKAPEDYTLLDKTFVLTVNKSNSQVYSTYTTTSSKMTESKTYTEEKYMTAEEYTAYEKAVKDELQKTEGTTSFKGTTGESGFYRNAMGEIFTKQALIDAKVMEKDATDAPTGYTAVNKYTVTTEVVTTNSMSTSSTVVDKETNPTEKAYIDIPNTPLVGLPSTGGIGTTIFTIAGILIMIAAAAMFFVSRRKRA